MKSIILQVILVFLIFSLTSFKASNTQISGWTKIDADGRFSFCLPAGFTKTDMAGVERYLGEYYKGTTRFFFLWGDTASDAYSDRRQPEMQDYEETETTIDGKRANIRSYSEVKNGKRFYRVELDVGDWKNARITLYMDLESNDPRDIAMAKQIFNSVKFLKP
ncbi:MAG TPA: hypothetical protein VF397_00470 [Pyrinomonadaceae bacterium]